MLTCLLLALAASDPFVRPPLSLTASPSLGKPVVASDQNLTAVAWLDGQSVRASFSDGRGLAWSAPITLNPSNPPPTFEPAVCVAGESALVAWIDRRHGVFPQSLVSTPFLRAYEAATGTLSAEVELAAGLPVNKASSGTPIIAAERVGAISRVHVLVPQAIFAAPPVLFGGPPALETILRLYTSNDGGHTFPIVSEVAHLASGVYVSQLQLEVEQDDVHVLWTDNRLGPVYYQLFYQRSSDGGQSFDFPVEHQLTSQGAIQRFDADAFRSTIAIGLHDLSFDPSTGWVDWGRIETRVSVDRGSSFSPQAALPDANSPTAAFLDPTVAISRADFAISVAWPRKEPAPAWSIDRSRSLDGGAHWSAEPLLTPSLGTSATLLADPTDRSRMLLRCDKPDGAHVAFSLDSGASWAPSVPCGSSNGGSCWNSSYQNFVAAWVSGPPNDKVLWVGGTRPQTITPIGFQAGPASPQIACERFDDGNSVAFVLASLAPGSFVLPFGDGRELGLAPDALFTATANLALAGVLAVPLDAQGAGTSAALAGPVLPAGLQLSLVGVTFELATLSFGDISDVVSVQL